MWGLACLLFPLESHHKPQATPWAQAAIESAGGGQGRPPPTEKQCLRPGSSCLITDALEPKAGDVKQGSQGNSGPRQLLGWGTAPC